MVVDDRGWYLCSCDLGVPCLSTDIHDTGGHRPASIQLIQATYPDVVVHTCPRSDTTQE